MQWNNLETVTFTVVEAGIGIVCACLPPIAPLYASVMQKWGLMASEPEYSKGSVYQAPPTVTPRSPPHNRKPSRILSITSSLAEDKSGVEFQNLVPSYCETRDSALSSVAEPKKDDKHKSESREVQSEPVNMSSTALPAVGERQEHNFDDFVPEYMEMDNSSHR